MNARIEVAPELLAKARYLYEHTLAPVDDIAAMLGMSKTPFYRRVQEGGWTPRRVRFAAGEFARAVMDGALISTDAALAGASPVPPGDAGPPLPNDSGPSEPLDRVALAARLMKAVERYIAAVERVQAKIDPATPAEADRNARSLAVIGRSLNEVAILLRPPRDDKSDDADDDTISVDSDEYRRELAEALDRLIDAERRRTGEGDRGPESPAD
jgi:hypothetical protein